MRSLTIITAAAALLVPSLGAPSPIAQPSAALASDAGTLAIPLQKRASSDLTTEDGTVHWERAQAHLAHIQQKFIKGAVNYQLNTGGDRLLDANLLSTSELVALQHIDRRAWLQPEGDSLEWENPYMPPAMAKRDEASGDKVFGGIRGARPMGFGAGLATAPRRTKNVKKQAAASAPAAAAALATRAEAGVALTNYNSGMLWTGAVTIGTPGTQFILDFDTGSSDLWVPASSCTLAACTAHTRYDPSSSSTSALVADKSLKITYGDGSSTSGSAYSETVTVAGITVTGQVIGAASQMSPDFAKDPFDGIMGMAFQSISQMNTPPVFQTMLAQFKLNNADFSFRLGATGQSELYLGGLNPSQFVAGTTQWYPVTSQSYWVIQGSMLVSSAPAVTGFNAIIDTGTTVIVAPSSAAKAFWASVPNSALYGSGYYTYPCDSPPAISMAFGGTSHEFAITPANFNLGRVSAGSARCVGAVVGADIGINGWIVGGSFLKNVYSTFDIANNRVGFSNLS